MSTGAKFLWLFPLCTACAENISAVSPCRVHALFHTNKICCEPLTEWLHFADLRDGQPDYMVYLVRTIQALGVLVNSVCMEPAAAHQPLQLRAARNKQLIDGIPHMLRNNRLVLCCQRPQIGYKLAPRLMQQARWPNEVPACACVCCGLHIVCQMVLQMVLLHLDSLQSIAWGIAVQS